MDANVEVNFKLREQTIPINHQLHNINKNRHAAKTAVRLWISHHRAMKINADGNEIIMSIMIVVTLSCDKYLSTELTKLYILDCQAILLHFQNLGILSSKINLYQGNIVQIAKAVILGHGLIWLILDFMSSSRVKQY